jgi:hypothetical protein
MKRHGKRKDGRPPRGKTKRARKSASSEYTVGRRGTAEPRSELDLVDRGEEALEEFGRVVRGEPDGRGVKTSVVRPA